MSFAHQSTPPGVAGVSDHGLLTGLLDDDHAQYALADKSRPSPWVAAADLSPRSLADLGTRAHDLLTGLLDDDHSIYALLSGRSGGQTFKGGLAASEHLTLQSTAHATRGRVRAQDDVQLLSNILRDSGGNERVKLATASPHIVLTGNVRLEGMVGFQCDPTAGVDLNICPGVGDFTALRKVIEISPSGAVMDADTSFAAVSGKANVTVNAGRTASYIDGLYYQAAIIGDGNATAMHGVRALIGAVAHYGTITDATALKADSPFLLMTESVITRAQGLLVDNQGSAYVATACGVRIADQTGSLANRCLEVGPATPYLRVLGGWTPTANQTPLYLSEGATPTLRQLRTKAGDTLGAGDLVVVAV